MKSIVKCAKHIALFPWYLLKLIWLLVYVPWRANYFKKRWRYGLTVEQVEWFVQTLNNFAYRIAGKAPIKIKYPWDRWFWWYVANALLKYTYRSLKHSQQISEADSHRAFKFFRFFVPHVSANGPSIKASLAEFRYDDYSGFCRRSLATFEANHGNIFTTEFIFFAETLFRYATPDSIRAMESAFNYAKDRLSQKCQCEIIGKILTVADNAIGLAKEAPLVLCDGMLKYADHLAQTARDFNDMPAANIAITALHHMERVRYRIVRHLYTPNCRAELYDYLTDIGRAGGAIYNHLKNPIPQLPAPQAPLPPTPREAALMREVARLNEELELAKKRNASRDCSKCFVNSIEVAVRSSVKEGIDDSLIGTLNMDGQTEISQTEAARQLGVDRATVGRWNKFCKTKGADGTPCPVEGYSPLLLKSKTAFEQWAPRYKQWKAVNASKRKRSEPKSYSAAEKQDHDDIENMFSSLPRCM